MKTKTEKTLDQCDLLIESRLFVNMNGVGSVVTVTPEAASMARARSFQQLSVDAAPSVLVTA